MLANWSPAGAQLIGLTEHTCSSSIASAVDRTPWFLSLTCRQRSAEHAAHAAPNLASHVVHSTRPVARFRAGKAGAAHAVQPKAPHAVHASPKSAQRMHCITGGRGEEREVVREWPTACSYCPQQVAWSRAGGLHWREPRRS